MKILNFDSLSYDYVYLVDHILLPREASAAWRMGAFIDDKGLNRSVALARTGVGVWHAGQVGEEDGQFPATCRENNVNIEYIRQVSGKSGHTMIQVGKGGQNNILLFSGANRSIPQNFADEVLVAFGERDLLLLQSEINGIPRLIENAHARGMRIIPNPSPYDEMISEYDLSRVSILPVNEIEGWQVSAQWESGPILEVLAYQYPELAVVLTLDSQSVVYQYQSEYFSHGVYPVSVVDTTVAGDTFTGYFLVGMTRGLSVSQSLGLASKASSIAVTRHGAAPSVPLL